MPERTVVRPRLLELLERRWDQRVVTVVAGPGFGKTALLVAATTDPGPRSGRDVWLTCEPGDESAEHLAAGLAQALGLRPTGDLEAVLAAVWSQAPAPVCIVLDDVHEVPIGSAGASLLRRLVTDLAGNGHLLFASRDSIPVPLARLDASGQLTRVGEDDLLFDEAELDSFAVGHDVDPGLLAPTGGWPALAELAASARAGVVLDFLWDEVLARIGHERAQLLARFSAVRGGDDEIASTLAGRSVSVDEVTDAVPLVGRSTEGWSVLHPLWEPALRRLLTAEETTAARRQAAAVHRRRGRYGVAVDLLVEAGAWPDVLELICEAARLPAHEAPSLEFGRWYRALPSDWRREPAAQLAAALELKSRSPLEALARFEAAADGFRARGDVDDELAAISHGGMVRWWMNDGAGLFALFVRVAELEAAGSTRAATIAAVGRAALAHLQGDSAAVLAALDGIGADVDPGWLAAACWLRSVAHRRDGDLRRAHAALDRAADASPERLDTQREIARLRIEWLEGRVDDVAVRMRDLHTGYAHSGDAFLAREAALELAGKAAWLGDADTSRRLVDSAATVLPEAPSVVARVLEVIARTAIAVAAGDEAGAAALIGPEILSGVAALGRPDSWYWRDRAAIALAHVLVPDSRSAWSNESLGPAHMPGLALAEALEAARAGDLGPLRATEWPEPGVVRAHLPLRWVVELAAAGTAARNPPPDDLLRALGDRAGPMLHAIASNASSSPIAQAASRLARELPPVPPYRLRIRVLGQLQLWRDDEHAVAPELRRPLVRELLCLLVARRLERREAVSAELWPDAADPAPNLRVTLNHLQRALQPERAAAEPPYFLRSSGPWLELVVADCLTIDAWDLESRLEEAAAAERAANVAGALDAYRAVLEFWQGEPYADAPYARWAEAERTRLRRRYVGAAIRFGDLTLAAGAVDEAAEAAERAIAADRDSEPAYRLLARTQVARNDTAAARTTLRRCFAVLAELEVEADAATTALDASLTTVG